MFVVACCHGVATEPGPQACCILLVMASTWHTYTSAAKRVGRSRRTIRHWGAQGMPMSWRTIDGQPTRVVLEHVLLKWYRERFKNDPVHQQLMRAKRSVEAS